MSILIRKCPKCGSQDYERGKTVDLKIIHNKGIVNRYIEHDGIMQWWFTCLRCGYTANEDDLINLKESTNE